MILIMAPIQLDVFYLLLLSKYYLLHGFKKFLTALWIFLPFMARKNYGNMLL